MKSALILVLASTLSLQSAKGIELKSDGYHVHPGENIQDAIELAAKNRTNKVVRVHAATYKPRAKRQALIWFNYNHDGVVVEAVGEVTLTAANPELSAPSSRSHPAVVNHVVYFGDGVSSNTVLRGFRITGANNYITDKFTKQMEPDETVPKNSFFLSDGGGIKIFGRSYPVIDKVEVFDNYASPCGGGISVQHQGFTNNAVLIQNSIIRGNRAQATGGGVDLLAGSSARIINCLFVGNASNLGEDSVAKRSGEKPFTNCGALTIFQNCRAVIQNCTFTGNRNAVDDMAEGTQYLNCIFYQNNLQVGLPAPRYELDLQKPAVVNGCFIKGELLNWAKQISSPENNLSAPDPMFDEKFIPRSPVYDGVGFRPVK